MPQHSTVLQSPNKRVRLVPPSADDDEAAASCRTHPITRRFLRFLPVHMSIEEARTRRETRAEDERIVDFNIHYVHDDGTVQFGGFSGCFNIDEQNNSCESGIIVSPDLHGKSVATEAFYILLRHIFEERKIHRTTFETGADNVPMQRWLENVAGARLESDRKEAWRNLDGSYADVKGYAIVESEWRDHVKTRLEIRLARNP
ncbi:acyl-CoA N-acyltransferase [Pholiota conissans]|uniref:Acyl-CoA N-acyltransferase n=1 Tax=Pholiota conissans TaxID=109636 RepID=A0A9P6D3D5_9AGAR|nr:acyl-CoA N-acyltransferase [Pholiota conissans]